MRNQDLQYDLTRSDKRYSITIPSYNTFYDVVLYNVKLKDLINNKQYTHQFRFKQFKQYHDNLSDLKIQLPQFPKTHFWKKTNKNPQLIQDRRAKLSTYFAIVINDPFIRGYSTVKKFIKRCKLGQVILQRTKSTTLLHQTLQKLKRQKSLETNLSPVKITFSTIKT